MLANELVTFHEVVDDLLALGRWAAQALVEHVLVNVVLVDSKFAGVVHGNVDCFFRV